MVAQDVISALGVEAGGLEVQSHPSYATSDYKLIRLHIPLTTEIFMCMYVFSVAPLTIASKWNLSTHPSADE